MVVQYGLIDISARHTNCYYRRNKIIGVSGLLWPVGWVCLCVFHSWIFRLVTQVYALSQANGKSAFLKANTLLRSLRNGAFCDHCIALSLRICPTKFFYFRTQLWRTFIFAFVSIGLPKISRTFVMFFSHSTTYTSTPLPTVVCWKP